MNNKEQALFRVDGNSEIGLGHVMRSLALADMISDQFDCSFFCINPSEYIKNEISKYCKEIFIIENESTFINLILRGQIIVLDGYQFSSEYMQKIVNKGAKLICIDDMHNKFYPAHLIINHSPSAIATNYEKAPYTKLLLGLDYALLRKPFRNASKQKKATTSFKNLLVSMGGADSLNLSQIVLNAAIASGQFENISVIAAPERRVQLNYSEQMKVYSHLSAEKIAELMLHNDIMIGPASSVTLEALATNLPVICGYYEENQKEFYNYLNDNKIVFGAGNFRDLLEEQFINIFKNGILFFNNKLISKLIDGNQTSRFLSAFNSLTYE